MIIDGDKQTPTNDDGSEQLQSLEITIPDETGDKQVETGEKKQEQQQAAPKEKKSGRFQQRIDHLTARASEAETTAQRLQRENDELREKYEKQGKDLQVADRAAFNNHADRVAANLKIAKAELVRAQNDGDAEKIADATADVSKWGAEQSRVDAWKQAHPEPDPNAKPADTKPADTKQTQQPQRKVEYTPQLNSFLERNQWFVPNSGEFDQDMHFVARRFATKLEEKYKNENRANEIGDEKYYGAIEQHMKKVFPDHEWDDDDGGGDVNEEPPQRGLPKMNGDQQQPSGRSQSNGNGARPGGSSTKVTLTGEQRGFVRSMVDNGAYGPVNPATNKPWTYAEAEVRYGREVLRDKEIQRQKTGGQ